MLSSMTLMMDASFPILGKPTALVSDGDDSQPGQVLHERAERPAKRVKLSEDEESGGNSSNQLSGEEDLAPDSPSRRNVGIFEDDAPSATPFESSVPDTKTDEKAIREYEEGRADETSASADDGRSNVEKRLWIKGRSSIYVDAFNLALDTVLEDEAHLFDQGELGVFVQWRALSYESQYL
jgi:fanconi-associated nuclease 1